MRAADLHDLGELLFFFLQRAMQMRQRGDQPARDLFRRRDMHRGREAVVRRLAHIHMIIGMHRAFRADLAAEHFDRAVGDHFVGIHVALRAGAGLPDHQRKMAAERAVDHFLRGAHDGAAAFVIERSERHIGFGRRALDDAHRAHERRRHAVLADAEIADRALRLRAPIAFGGHIDRPERVGFGAGFLRRRFAGHDDRPRGYFLRKRSRRTTSPLGLSSGSTSLRPASGLAGAGRGPDARSVFDGVASLSASDGCPSPSSF